MHKAIAFLSVPPRRAMLGAFLLACIVYAGVAGHDFVRWDDGMLIYENPAIRGITPFTIRWIFTHFDPELYIPLTFFSYQLNYLIGAIDPTGYHVTNLVLHALNAALVVQLLFMLTGRLRIAAFCGLLFAVHPLHTEAVAWASGRKDVLSTAFFLGAWIAFLRFEDRGSRRAYVGSLVLHLGGLLSKVVSATLPAAILLDVLLFRPRTFRRSLTHLVPHIALSAAFIGVALLGKEELVARTSVWQKALMACLSTAFYIKQMVWPVRFSLLYPYGGEIAVTNPDFFVPLILVVASVGLAAALWRKLPVVPFAVFGYLGTLAPTFVNFAKGGDLDIYFASDRYAYIPSIFVFLLGAVMLAALSDRLAAHIGRRTSPFAVIATVTVVTLSLLAFRQNRVWRDTASLFEHVIAVYPEMSHVAYNNLCNMYRFQGDFDTAIATCRKALAVRPHAKIWSNIGGAYRAKGMVAEARDAYREALTLDYKNPHNYLGLGLVEEQAGNPAAAEKNYRTAIDLDPTLEEARVNLGALLTKAGRWQEAAEQFRAAIALNPFFIEAHHNLGVAQEMLGDAAGAVASYREAVRLKPDYTASHVNLGVLLARLGNRTDAVEQFRAILRYDPANVTAQNALKQLTP